jgi:hypothetical protein
MISFCLVTGTKSNFGPPASVGYSVILRLIKASRNLNKGLNPLSLEFFILSSIQNLSIPLLIVIYRNWLFDKSRKQNYNQTKETQMNESTEQLIQQLRKEDLWTETLTLINEELVKRMSSPDRRVKLIAQLHFDEFDISTTQEVAKALGVSIRRVQQLKAAMSNEIKLAVLSRQTGI